jgi:PBP1b-binding outer membrane lipoprotein LpoB
MKKIVFCALVASVLLSYGCSGGKEDTSTVSPTADKPVTGPKPEPVNKVAPTNKASDVPQVQQAAGATATTN